jgi:tetratricopeptide (TPR) repeat protein
MIDNSTLIQLRLEYCQKLSDQDSHQGALLEIEELLDEHNECVDALYLAGQTYLLLRDSPSAEQCFRQIQRLAFLEDQQAELYLSLALSLFFQYRFSESLEEFKNSLKHNSQTALTWRYQAMAQERCGYLKLAVRSAKTAYKLDSENNNIPDWQINNNISSLNDSLKEVIEECNIVNIIWKDFPIPLTSISRRSVSPQQVIFIDSTTSELVVYFGNLKYIAFDLDQQFIFLKNELQRITPTLL